MDGNNLLAISGRRSTIAKAVAERVEAGRLADAMWMSASASPLTATHYFFCAGFLTRGAVNDLSDEDLEATYRVNLIEVMRACDLILSINERARICVMGSASGISGSFNMAYATAKAGLHLYVETKALRPGQQLVAVAPWIVEDTNMTRGRPAAELDFVRQSHPQQRFTTAANVAAAVVHVLFVDDGYINNTVIRMDGGRHAAV